MILGLHGKIGAGKNACAERLALLSELPVVEVSFARKLKESASALLGCTVADLERWKNDPVVRVIVYGERVMLEEPQTVRSFLQRYGTEAHRDIFGADFWLDAALPIYPWAERGVTPEEYSDALYVVTDVRFPNEADRVRDLGGVMVCVVGPNDDTGSHVSEQPLECDYALSNVTRDDGFALLDKRLAALLHAIEERDVLERLAA